MTQSLDKSWPLCVHPHLYPMSWAWWLLRIIMVICLWSTWVFPIIINKGNPAGAQCYVIKNEASDGLLYPLHFPAMQSRVHRAKASLRMRVPFHGWWSVQYQCSKPVALAMVLGCKLYFLMCGVQPAGKAFLVKARWAHICLLCLWALCGGRWDFLQPDDIAACPWGSTLL